jgi:membrane protease YdiL (CAAX protease family)
MSLRDVAMSAVVQALVLGGLPLLVYIVVQKWRHHRPPAESIRRAGLCVGDRRYLLYALGIAVLGNALLVGVIWWLSPSLDAFTREGAAQRPFVGLGFTTSAFAMAFLNGAVQTGFTEELLFRGLIAGALSRRLSFLWANVSQAVIFLLPHLLILLVEPGAWPFLPLVFVGALTLGWLRIRSGSILGSTLVHASGNMTIALIVAVRTAA